MVAVAPPLALLRHTKALLQTVGWQTLYSYKHNHTPRCFKEVSIAGLCLLVQALGRQSSATRPEVEGFTDEGFVLHTT